MEKSEAGTRYDQGHEHTHMDGCPECERLKLDEFLSPDNQDVKELAQALMNQWDDMITKLGTKVVEKLRVEGKRQIGNFAKLLGADDIETKVDNKS